MNDNVEYHLAATHLQKGCIDPIHDVSVYIDVRVSEKRTPSMKHVDGTLLADDVPHTPCTYRRMSMDATVTLVDHVLRVLHIRLHSIPNPFNSVHPSPVHLMDTDIMLHTTRGNDDDCNKQCDSTWVFPRNIYRIYVGEFPAQEAIYYVTFNDVPTRHIMCIQRTHCVHLGKIHSAATAASWAVTASMQWISTLGQTESIDSVMPPRAVAVHGCMLQ